MSHKIFIFLFTYFFIIFSSIGFGNFFLRYSNLKNNFFCIGNKGIFGIFFLIIYSYLSHYLYPHTQFHNLAILLIGFFLLLIFYQDFERKDFINTIFIFSIIFIGLLFYKTHDDFPYYHFPYTFNLTQNNIIFGIGKINHGFKTPSSIFYLNSLFYLPIIKYYTFSIGAALVLGFSNLIFLKIILDKLKIKRVDFIFYFSLLSFVFVNVFFYRLSEHGTDRSAMILIFIFFINILIFIENFKKNTQDMIAQIAVLISLIISFKAFYILYSIFIIPLVFYLIKNNKVIVKNSFKNIYLYISILLILLVSLSYFTNTGCFLYPVILTCVENTGWSLSMELINKMGEWYQIWSKGGAGPNFRVENPTEYIKGFNWVPNWIEIYFFNKVSDFILGILFLSVIFLITFNEFKIKKKNIFYNPDTFGQIMTLYILILFLFFEWFYNHPALRYGGYVIFALIVFIPLSIFLSRVNYNKKFYIKTYFLIFLTLTIFFLRNSHRIYKEMRVYSYEPITEPYYFIDDHHFRIDKKLKKKIE